MESPPGAAHRPSNACPCLAGLMAPRAGLAKQTRIENAWKPRIVQVSELEPLLATAERLGLRVSRRLGTGYAGRNTVNTSHQQQSEPPAGLVVLAWLPAVDPHLLAQPPCVASDWCMSHRCLQLPLAYRSPTLRAPLLCSWSRCRSCAACWRASGTGRLGRAPSRRWVALSPFLLHLHFMVSYGCGWSWEAGARAITQVGSFVISHEMCCC